MKRLQGKMLNPGVGSGIAFTPTHVKIEMETGSSKTKHELEEYYEAIDAVKNSIFESHDYKAGDEKLTATLALLEDDAFTGNIKKLIRRKKLTAVAAANAVGTKFYKSFSVIDNEEMKKQADFYKITTDLIVAELLDIEHGHGGINANDSIYLIDILDNDNLELVHSRSAKGILLKNDIEDPELLTAIKNQPLPVVVMGDKINIVRDGDDVSIVDDTIAF